MTKHCTLKQSDINHLMRLLGWVRCEIGPSPEELVQTTNGIRGVIGEPSDEGKQRLLESYKQSAQVPQYVRAAVKALEKTVKDYEGSIVDVKIVGKALPRTSIPEKV